MELKSYSFPFKYKLQIRNNYTLSHIICMFMFVHFCYVYMASHFLFRFEMFEVFSNSLTIHETLFIIYTNNNIS